MPFPIRRDYIRERQGSLAVGEWTLNIPRPVATAEGDWVVAVICVSGSSVSVTDLSGWNEILVKIAGTRTTGIFARRCDEDDGASYPLILDTPVAGVGAAISSFAIGDGDALSNWVIGEAWRRQDNGGSQATTISPGINAPANSLVLAIETEATNAPENDGDEITVGATKWFNSPDQPNEASGIERVLVSYIENKTAATTNPVTTTWPNSIVNGMGVQIAIPYLESSPPPVEYAKDTFERTIAPGGWGAADIGGVWMGTKQPEHLYVQDGKAHATAFVPTAAPTAQISNTTHDDIEMYIEWSVDKIPTADAAGSTNLRPRFVTRGIAGVGDYHLRASITVEAKVDFRWYRDDTAGIGSLTVLPGTYTPGDVLKVRIQTYPDGPSTRLRARMWYATESEPTEWLIDVTDSTPEYQVPGVIKIVSSAGGGVTNTPATFSYDNFLVTPRGLDATTTTGNIGFQAVTQFSQTTLRVSAKFLQDTQDNQLRLEHTDGTLVSLKRPTINVSKWGYADFTGLSPNTEYTVKFVVGVVEQTDSYINIRTMPSSEPTSFTAVAGSCQFTGSTHPIFLRIAEDKPLFVSHMGDLHYQDATDETSWRLAVEASLSSLTMRSLLKVAPISWTWDNHDRIIVNTLNMGTTLPETVTAWREAAGSTGWSSGDTMGRTWSAGRVRFIQTDQWSVRDDPNLDVEPRTFLGSDQKQWWKDTLLASKEAIIIWFCSWTAQNHANGRWNSFNAETTELENWLNAHPSIKERLILVGGDSHQLQADSGTRTRAQGSRFAGVPSLNASGFNRSSTGEGGANWDIISAPIREDNQSESAWGAYSRLTFTDDGTNIDMLWEAVRVNQEGIPDIMASWGRTTGTVVIDNQPAIAQYYREDQARIQPLSIEIGPED